MFERINMEKKLIREDSVSLDNISEYTASVSKIFKNKDIIIMKGNLGYGKTTLTRHIARNFDSENIVSSPSFTIINEYDIVFDGEESVLRHIDLYRLESYDDLYSVGLDSSIYEDGISIIEWGDKFIDFFNTPYYILEIESVDDDKRLFRLFLLND